MSHREKSISINKMIIAYKKFIHMTNPGFKIAFDMNIIEMAPEDKIMFETYWA
jgi:hypothetical protein